VDGESLVLVAGSCRSQEATARAPDTITDATAVEAPSERQEAPKFSLAERDPHSRRHGPKASTVVGRRNDRGRGRELHRRTPLHGRVQEVVVRCVRTATSRRPASVPGAMARLPRRSSSVAVGEGTTSAHAVEIARGRTANGQVFGAQLDLEGDADQCTGSSLVDGETVMDVTSTPRAGEGRRCPRAHGRRGRRPDGKRSRARADEPMDESHESPTKSREKPERH
jgi:hypothetical protein